jgi:MFS transporter, PPP family, 3-phenylpropionic acid transporter
MAPSMRNALVLFLLLFAALYAGFGVQSPFLPGLLQDRGLRPEAIGTVLAAGTMVRLAAGPLAGRLADRLDAAKLVFAGCAAAAALMALLYLSAEGLWALLLVSFLHAAALAPLAPLSDTLALGTAAPAGGNGASGPGFDYGWIRGTGSAAFIVGTILSGQLVGAYGIAMVIWLQALLLAAAAFCAPWVRQVPRRLAQQSKITSPERGGVMALFRLGKFPLVMLVAALILGSHALHDSFAVIRWNAAGIGPGAAGLLWSEAVAGEVVVFFIIGRPLLDRLGPSGAAALAATAGMVRWSVEAQTAWLPAMAAIQPLHGFTFALLHLANMRLLAETVPPRLAATALTVYGTVGVGAAVALMTLVSGSLYARFGAHGFWAMAMLCAIALPLARRLRKTT